jgi:DNA-binding transcriptional LysR family regulator
MEWQQIVGFYHVATLKSFTRAGEVTLRTQSALSQQIKALEEELACRLFERIGRQSLKLTSAGERFLLFAKSVLDGYEDLKDELGELKDIQKGPLKIAAPFTTLYHLFPDKLKVYLEQFPQVELTLLDRPQSDVVELVRDGSVDFGFALESFIPKDFTAVRWKKVEVVLLVPQGHPLTRAGRVSLEQLARHPLILPPKTAKYAGRLQIEKELYRRRIPYRVVMESSNVELSSVYVEMGLGVSFATVVRDLPVARERGIELIPLDHYFNPDYIAIVMRKSKVLAPYKSAFLNVLLHT